MNIFGAPTSNTLNKVRPMIARALARWAGFSLIGKPGFVGIVPIDGEVTVRAIKDIANGVGLRVLRT